MAGNDTCDVDPDLIGLVFEDGHCKRLADDKCKPKPCPIAMTLTWTSTCDSIAGYWQTPIGGPLLPLNLPDPDPRAGALPVDLSLHCGDDLSVGFGILLGSSTGDVVKITVDIFGGCSVCPPVR